MAEGNGKEKKDQTIIDEKNLKNDQITEKTVQDTTKKPVQKKVRLTKEERQRLEQKLAEMWPSKTKEEILNKNFSGNIQGGYYRGPGYLSPNVYDIDNNGDKEIIIHRYAYPSELLVYNPNGSLLWVRSLPKSIGDGWDAYQKPLIVDINNDSKGEIIVYNRYQGGEASLYAYDYEGLVLWESEVLPSADAEPTLLAADLDNDGKKEIIVKGNSGDWVYNEATGESESKEALIIFDNLGKIKKWWWISDTSWGASIPGTPAVGNFDDDDDLEIVVGTLSASARYDPEKGEWINEGVLAVYNLDGSFVNGWPFTNLPGEPFSSPVVGDINNDGKNEIIIGLLYAINDEYPDEKYGGLYAFDRNGKILPGWPIKKGNMFWAVPSLADVNHDKKLEIAASACGDPFETYIFDYQGNISHGWPTEMTYTSWYSLATGDINNDSSLDILTTAGGIYSCQWEDCGGVYAWNKNGTLIKGFPKITETDAQAPATIDDIDHDGKVEIIASSDDDYDLINQITKLRGSIYVWDLNSSYNAGTMEWPMFMHDTQHTGMHPFSPTVPCQNTNTNCGLNSENCEDCTLKTPVPRCEGNTLKQYNFVCSNNGCVENITPTSSQDCTQIYVFECE